MEPGESSQIIGLENPFITGYNKAKLWECFELWTDFYRLRKKSSPHDTLVLEKKVQQKAWIGKVPPVIHNLSLHFGKLVAGALRYRDEAPEAGATTSLAANNSLLQFLVQPHQTETSPCVNEVYERNNIYEQSNVYEESNVYEQSKVYDQSNVYDQGNVYERL